MALIKYLKTFWRNNQSPSINETALNKIEDQLERVTDETINLDSSIESVNTRVSNIIANSGTSSTEVVDARLDVENTLYTTLKDKDDAWQQRTKDTETEIYNAKNSVTFGPFGTLDERLENEESELIRVEDKIDNSFALDLQKAYGNVKTIDDGQDVGLWISVSGTTGVVSTDVVNYKIGNSSIRVTKLTDTASGFGLYLNNVDFNFDTLNNGEESTTEDFVSLIIYNSDIAKIGSVSIYLSNSSIVDTLNSIKRENINLATGWNFLKIKKSEFITVGSGTFESVKSIYVRGASNAGSLNSYLSFQSIQLVKKDPLTDYPNPFQKFGVRDFAIESGEWFVGEEFGKVVMKEISVSVLAFGALRQGTSFYNFKSQLSLSTTSATENRYSTFFSEEVGVGNRIECYVASDNAVLRAIKSSSVESSVTKPFPIDVGDIITYILTKNGSNLQLHISKNGGELREILSIETTMTEKFKMAIGNSGGTLTRVHSASITEIAHAHHADVAEVAKGLAIKYQSGAFIPKELDYSTYGIDTANNRIYVKKSRTQVIYFTGTVV